MPLTPDISHAINRLSHHSESQHPEKSDARLFIESLYTEVSVTYHGAVEGKALLFGLPTELLPVSPLEHQWFNSNQQYVLKKHHSALEQNIDIVIYGPNIHQQINYLTLFNQVNHQSYAVTRFKTFGYDFRKIPFNARKDYRVPGYEYLSGKYHMPGHCIDHADTIEAGLTPYSSYDKRNFIPEPPHSDWGGILRRDVVRRLRKIHGAYMQLPYYEPTPLLANNGTPVPAGVFFGSIHNHQLGKICKVSWDIDFKQYRASGLKLDQQILATLEVPSWQMPLAAIYNTEASDFSIQQELINYSCLQKQDKEPITLHGANLYYQRRAAEAEFLSPHHKIELTLQYSSFQQAQTAKRYLSRTQEHANYLKDLDKKKPLMTTTQYQRFQQAFLKEAPGFEDADDRQKDFFRQLHQEQQPWLKSRL